jgi:AraC-like DNA-binding protein
MRAAPELFGIETVSAAYFKQTFKPHGHDEYLLGVIDSGIHAVWCRGEMNHVPGGTVVTMRPGDIHHGGAGGDAGWTQRMIYIPEAGMRSLLLDATGHERVGTLDFDAAFHAKPILARRLSRLLRIIHGATLSLQREVALDVLLRDVISALLPDISPQERIPDGRILDAVDFLNSRIAEDVSLAQLCEVTGLRRRQTIEAFRRVTGLSPHAWHVQIKVAYVKRLLRAGVSPAVAALEAGFADQSHMGRHFRAIVGTTPANYARS